MSDVTSVRPLPKIQRLVVKIGSAVVAPGGSLDQASVDRLADDVAAVRRMGVQVTLVSSGAIASGFRLLGLNAPPTSIELKQAAAAVGQQRLMAAWAAAFGRHGLTVGQLLLTSDDMLARRRYLNARHTLAQLHQHGVAPVINENDSVSYDEIHFGDNDALSAYVSGLVDADLLLILSRAKGLYAEGDENRVIPLVRLGGDAEIAGLSRHVTDTKTLTGVGGMASKLTAIGVAWKLGVPALIAGGDEPGVMGRVLSGENLGTLFLPVDAQAPSRRKAWIMSTVRSAGTVRVDAGAARAVVGRRASLLPSGVTAVSGTFERGEPVDVCGPDGVVIARGLTAYASEQIERIKGLASDKIAAALGQHLGDEVIHRDDMAVLASGGGGTA